MCTVTAIDSRYRSGKPLIVTTNLKVEEIKNPSDLVHARIYDRILEHFSKTSKGTMSAKIKRILKMRYSKCKKAITIKSRDSEMCWLPACKIRRLMVVWRYENERESR